MLNIRSKLVTAAAVGAAALGGAAIAGAATPGNAHRDTQRSRGHPGPGPARPVPGGHTVNGKTETLSGDVESKVRAAALAKVAGTVERVETNVDSSAPYHGGVR